MPFTKWKPDGKFMKSLAGEVKFFVTHRLPPGIRSFAGLFLIIGGVLGFLPILGFWMIPLGLALITLDLMKLFRFLTGWPSEIKDETQITAKDSDASER